MRLFIGIDLSQSMKSYLFNVSKTIEPHTRGHITREPNYHLTLAFLGELDDTQTEQLKGLMDTVDFKSFQMQLSDIDYFQKGERYIYYIRIQSNPSLKLLYQKVLDFIAPLNISLHGKFSPHITLIRQGKAFPVHALPLPKTEENIDVDTITLFLSHQVDGELTYTPIHRVKLK